MRRMVAKREACRAILLFIKPYARKHRLFRTQQKKPVLFVPSPNVAEDHQTKNAKALEAKGAAVVVPDAEARTAAMRRAMELLSDKEALRTMSENLEKLARPDAAERIVDEIEKVMK